MNKPTIPGYSNEDLEDLTPEEISALESDAEDNEEELTTTATEANPVADTAPAAPAAQSEQIATEEPVVSTTYVAEAPADMAAQMEALKQAKITAKADDKAALKKLMDGDIDFDEYEKVKTASEDAIEAANESIGKLNTATAKAEIATEMSQQETARAWTNEVNAMMAVAKSEGIDYKTSDALTKELNGLVRAFGQEATENGMTDEGLKASKWALAQAHALMKMRHPEIVKTPSRTAATPSSTAPRHALTTLNNMPNADRTLADNDTISKFSMLEGEDLERAMASMSFADVEKLMASV